MMNVYGRSRLSEFLGDRVIYRNLEPCDPAIPSLADLRARVGLAEGVVPRKNEPEYARVVAAMIRHTSKAEIRRLLILRLYTHVEDLAARQAIGQPQHDRLRSTAFERPA